MPDRCSQCKIFQHTVNTINGIVVIDSKTIVFFRCLASLLSGLVGYQEEIGTKVVDGVLEDIRLGMEINLPKFNQRRVAQIKYLGELYNYRMVESADVFKVSCWYIVGIRLSGGYVISYVFMLLQYCID